MTTTTTEMCTLGYERQAVTFGKSREKKTLNVVSIKTFQ